MSTRTRLMNIAMATAAMAATTSLTACDVEDETSWDAPALDPTDLEFRCSVIGGCADGQKANNSFVGEKPDYMFWYMPLKPDADPTMKLKQIRTNGCYDRTGSYIAGDFVVNDPTLSVSSLGAFEPFMVRDVTDPAFACEAYGTALQGSRWFLEGDLVNGQGGTDDVDVKLKIASIVVDLDGRTLYEWKSDLQHIYGGGSGGLQHTCDEAEGDEAEGIEFHAMLYRDLEVDPTDNSFGVKSDVAYIACLSGTIGKTGRLWDYDTTDLVTHQVAANAGMAAYCGNGVSYTETGTMIDLWNINGAPGEPDLDAPPTGPGEDFELEAVWTADNQAICIGTTRLPEHQPDWGSAGTGFPCEHEGQTWLLPECTQQHLDDPAAVLATYVGPVPAP